MEIYILRDGKQLGPFDEETTQSLLKQGAVMINDLAWQPGDAPWQPLHAVLYPAAQPTTTPPPPVDATPPPMPLAPPPIALAKSPAPEPIVLTAAPATIPVTAKPASGPVGGPASPRQKAFLSYMTVPFSTDMTKEQAALLVNEVMENPKEARRLQQWNADRLRLHPDIFADEIKARHENRATYFYDVCQGEGAEFFEKVTKAHTQVLIGYLDMRFPNWDEHEDEAKYSYLFPAIAEKFPQLLKKSARGKFKYPEGPKVAPELTRRSAMIAAPKSSSSTFGAMLRGAVMGLVILVVLYYTATIYYAVTRFYHAATKFIASAVIAPAAPKTATVSVAPATPAPHVEPPKAAEPVKPKPREPLVAANDEKAKPENDAPSPPAAEDSAPNSNAVALVSNPFDPLAPTTPIPARAAPAAPAPAVPTTPSGRTTIKLTKPTLVALKFGSSTLRPGTVLPFVGVEGANVKIRYGPEVVPIPAANTDINDDASAPQ